MGQTLLPPSETSSSGSLSTPTKLEVYSGALVVRYGGFQPRPTPMPTQCLLLLRNLETPSSETLACTKPVPQTTQLRQTNTAESFQEAPSPTGWPASRPSTPSISLPSPYSMPLERNGTLEREVPSHSPHLNPRISQPPSTSSCHILALELKLLL